MPKLLILSQDAEEYQALIHATNLPELAVSTFADIAGDPDQADQFEIVLGLPTLIRDLLPKLKNLRWAQSVWAGVSPLLAPSLRRDYTLTNVRDVFGESMTEYVFGYLLSHERRIFERYQAQKEKRWDGTAGTEIGSLRGKTIGLLGAGSIGAQIAKTAKHFGMIVHGYTRASQSCPDVDFYQHENLVEFVKKVDYLVNILPDTPDTQKVVNMAIFESLPKTALFINVGRGSVVDEEALLTALAKNMIAGAVLDVFEQEPLPKEHPFWTAPNLLLTFHTAAPSLPKEVSALFVENYHRFIEGKELKHLVDFERGY